MRLLTIRQEQLLRNEAVAEGTSIDHIVGKVPGKTEVVIGIGSGAVVGDLIAD